MVLDLLHLKSDTNLLQNQWSQLHHLVSQRSVIVF